MKRMQLMQNTIWKTSSLCAHVLTVYGLSWGYGNLIIKSAQDAPHQSVNALYKWMAKTTQSLEKKYLKNIIPAQQVEKHVQRNKNQ